MLAWAISSLLELVFQRALSPPPFLGAINQAVGYVLILRWLNRKIWRNAPQFHEKTGEIRIRHGDTGKILFCWADETLAGADLAHVQFQRVNLYGLDLCEATLASADLRSTRMEHCDLSQANLRRADLREATLSHANLAGADLCGAHLAGAMLSTANLSGAYYDADTTWLRNFDPVERGCILLCAPPSAPEEREPVRVTDGLCLPRPQGAGGREGRD